MENIVEIGGSEQFTAIRTGSTKLVFVDFWASRCGPCRMLSPLLHDLAQKYPEKVQIVKVNVDEEANADLAMQFQVTSIPQVNIFLQGNEVDKFVGVLPFEELEAYVTTYVK